MMRVEYDRVWMMNTNSECILIFGSYFYIEHYFSVDAFFGSTYFWFRVIPHENVQNRLRSSRRYTELYMGFYTDFDVNSF